jgi:hypothetical protein
MPCAAAAGGDANQVLAPQHRHRQRGVVRLVRAGEAGQGKDEFAEVVAIANNLADLREPFLISPEQARAAAFCFGD